ncbi:hypothetical protein ACIO3M_16565, partial [Streptomyces erythrochromogenes]
MTLIPPRQGAPPSGSRGSSRRGVRLAALLATALAVLGLVLLPAGTAGAVDDGRWSVLPAGTAGAVDDGRWSVLPAGTAGAVDDGRWSV